MHLTITNILDAAFVEEYHTHIIRLLDPNVVPRYTDKPNHVEYFYDIVNDSKNAPKREQIESILQFSESINKDDYLLIHCHYGISRSTAVGILVLIQHGSSIKDAMRQVQQLVPNMDPNCLILKHGDSILNLDGKLMEYYKEWCKNNSKTSRIETHTSEQDIDQMRNIMNLFR